MVTNHTSCRVRPYTREDRAAVRAIELACGHELAPHVAARVFDGDLARIAGAGPALLMECDGVVVASGAVRLDPATPGDAEVVAMRTHPDARRRGHAREILRRLILAARSTEGIHRLFLHALASQAAAHALYRGMGFREVGRGMIEGSPVVGFSLDLRST